MDELVKDHIKINEAWHKAKIMPKNPTLDARIRWNMTHTKHCSCLPIPPALPAEIEKRKYVLRIYERKVKVTFLCSSYIS